MHPVSSAASRHESIPAAVSCVDSVCEFGFVVSLCNVCAMHPEQKHVTDSVVDNSRYYPKNNLHVF
eukprot:gene11014-3085_t